MSLEFPPFKLLHWIVDNHDEVEYDLASSNMPPYVPNFGGRLEQSEMTAGSLSGTEELKGAISDLSGADPDNIFVTNGASEANFTICAAILSREDEVLVERPYYEPLANIPQGLGSKVKFVDRKPIDFPLDLEGLEALITSATRLLVLTNLHNPSGAMTSDGTMRALSEIAHQRGFYVLCDEIFKDFACAPPEDAFTFGERMISTVGISKFYGTGGFRVGWIIAEEEVLKRCQRVREHMAVTSCSLGESAALAALRERDYVAARNRLILQTNHQTVVEWATEQGIELLPWTGANVCFPELPIRDTVQFSKRLLEMGVLVSPGEFFGLAGHIRIGFGCENEILREGLERISEALVESGD